MGNKKGNNKVKSTDSQSKSHKGSGKQSRAKEERNLVKNGETSPIQSGAEVLEAVKPKSKKRMLKQGKKQRNKNSNVAAEPQVPPDNTNKYEKATDETKAISNHKSNGADHCKKHKSKIAGGDQGTKSLSANESETKINNAKDNSDMKRTKGKEKKR